jgi:hypothetical protein
MMRYVPIFFFISTELLARLDIMVHILYLVSSFDYCIIFVLLSITTIFNGE